MLSHSRLGAVWVLLVAAAAVELRDLPPADMGHDVIYQDGNDIDTGPLRFLHEDDTEATRLKDLLLYRLLQTHLGRLRSTEHRMHKKPSHATLLGPSGGLMKRLAAGARPQQRWWKAKKGKVIGSQMVCYFKLCAFRHPA